MVAAIAIIKQLGDDKLFNLFSFSRYLATQNSLALLYTPLNVIALIAVEK